MTPSLIPPSLPRLVLFAAAATLVLVWLLQYPTWGWTHSLMGVCAVFTALSAMVVSRPWA